MVGFNPLTGNPKVKKLKFIEIFNQSVHVNEFALHLIFRPLPLHAVAVHLVHSDQRAATCLQLFDDLQNQVHSLLHLLLERLLFAHPFLRLNPLPLIAQGLQPLVNLLEDRVETASDRHDAQDQ